MAATMLFVMVGTVNQTVTIVGISAYGFLGTLAIEPTIIS